ncbi:MAG: hypothetical protein AB7W59_18525 [Acidimicrobiia bacterium]
MSRRFGVVRLGAMALTAAGGSGAILVNLGLTAEAQQATASTAAPAVSDAAAPAAVPQVIYIDVQEDIVPLSATPPGPAPVSAVVVRPGTDGGPAATAAGVTERSAGATAAPAAGSTVGRSQAGGVTARPATGGTTAAAATATTVHTNPSAPVEEPAGAAAAQPEGDAAGTTATTVHTNPSAPVEDVAVPTTTPAATPAGPDLRAVTSTTVHTNPSAPVETTPPTAPAPTAPAAVPTTATTPPSAPPTTAPPAATNPPTTIPPTTVPPATLPPTTVPPAPDPGPTLPQRFTATAAGSPIGLATTVANDGATDRTVTVALQVSGAALPGYLEAKGDGWSCSAYIAQPTGSAAFTCTGSVAAKSSSVISVSSGSAIAAGARPVTATASLQPGGASTASAATIG